MGARPADRQRRLQKKLERLRSRKEKPRRGREHAEAGDGPAEVPGEAALWPVHECLVDPAWRTPPALVPVVVARSSPEGRLAAATFLVDLGCLGAKNGFARLLSARDYATLRERAFTGRREPCELALAAKIVRSGIAYAQELGFRPHPDVRAALDLLGPAQPCDVEVPLGGPEGKPFFVCGPDDDPERIVGQLASRFGPEGFHFIAPLPFGGAFDVASEEDDDWASGPDDQPIEARG